MIITAKNSVLLWLIQLPSKELLITLTFPSFCSRDKKNYLYLLFDFFEVYQSFWKCRLCICVFEYCIIFVTAILFQVLMFLLQGNAVQVEALIKCVAVWSDQSWQKKVQKYVKINPLFMRSSVGINRKSLLDTSTWTV